MNVEKNTTDVFVEDGPLEAAYFLFSELAVRFPPVPHALLSGLDEVGLNTYSNGLDVAQFSDALGIEESLAGPWPPSGVLFGYDVHGANSSAIYYTLCLPQILLHLRLPFGNAYGDAAAQRGELSDAFQAIESYLAQQELNIDRPPAAGRRVIILEGSRGARVATHGESGLNNWSETDGGLLA